MIASILLAIFAAVSATMYELIFGLRATVTTSDARTLERVRLLVPPSIFPKRLDAALYCAPLIDKGVFGPTCAMLVILDWLLNKAPKLAEILAPVSFTSTAITLLLDAIDAKFAAKTLFTAIVATLLSELRVIRLAVSAPVTAKV